MKNILTLSACMLATLCCHAYSPAGTWMGKLNIGKEIRVVFNITEQNGTLSATMDSPDQGVKGIGCSQVYVSGDSLYILMESFKSQYTGRFLSDSSISGVMQQGTKNMNLDIRKVEKIEGPVRKQTPVPPFPYRSEDVIYHNKDKSMQYGATITLPHGPGPFPAIVMSTGSGQQNRDEEIEGHKPFAVIADYLTRRGYIVLRIDDRGIGQTTGSPETSTTADHTRDALSGLEYLKGRKETNRKKMGIIGHSEGGLVAEMAAAQSKDIAFIVSLAGPGINIISLMEEQNGKVLREAGLAQEAVDAYLPLYNQVSMIVAHAATRDEARKEIDMAIKAWKEKAHPNVAFAFGLRDEASVGKMTDEFTGLYDNPWWRFFIAQEPQQFIEKLQCKVLALNGEKDIQVIPASNLNGFREALARSKSPAYEVKELPGLNHLFQKCKTCKISEYGTLEESFSPDALTVIGDWLDKNVK